MPPMAVTETCKLPEHFDIERELREQLSSRPGHQRCIEGAGELLLVVHEVPRPGIPEREALFFWKSHDGIWLQPSGTGIGGLADLLDRYAEAIDGHEATLDSPAASAAAIFATLRHAGPLARTSRNLLQALEHTLAIDPDDRAIRNCRDRAREIERAAELLLSDGRAAMEFRHAERAEQLTRSAVRLNHLVFRLNLLVGFFLPLLAITGWTAIQAIAPTAVRPWLAAILLGTGALATVLPWLATRPPGKSAQHTGEPRPGQ